MNAACGRVFLSVFRLQVKHMRRQREQEKTSWTDTVLAVLPSSHDSASGLFRTWTSSLTRSNHFALCSRTKRSSNPTPATLWCLGLVNRSNGPLDVTGLNTINVCVCVCCTAAIVCVSTKRQNEFRGIIILNSIDWGSREKCQKWSEMISSCTDLNYISTRATEENNLRAWRLSW